MKNKRGIVVAKFGGTSVSSRRSVSAIVGIVKRLRARNPVIVVSALSGVTEVLLSLARCRKSELDRRITGLRETHAKLVHEIFRDEAVRVDIMRYVDEQLGKIRPVVRGRKLSPAGMDTLVSFGEIMSSYIIAKVLESEGIDAQQVISTRVVATDDSFMHAEFLPKETTRNARRVLLPLIRRRVVPVVTGFIGASRGRITTLGRGGSDYSGSIIGFALDADEIQIWTDVDGVYSADPRIIKDAKLVPEISYREASEMAAFGAKVLHPRTTRPAVEKNIPVRVLNTFNPRGRGSLICSRTAHEGLKAIAFKRNVTLVNIYSASMLFSRGFLARVFEIFAKQNISIDLVSVSEASISVTLDNTDHLRNAIRQLEKISSVTASAGDFGMISLIGEKIASTHHLVSQVSSLFHKIKIPVRMISMGASDINISLVIPAADIVRAANALHNEILGAGKSTRSSVRHRTARTT